MLNRRRPPNNHGRTNNINHDTETSMIAAGDRALIRKLSLSAVVQFIIVIILTHKRIHSPLSKDNEEQQASLRSPLVDNPYGDNDSSRSSVSAKLTPLYKSHDDVGHNNYNGDVVTESMNQPEPPPVYNDITPEYEYHDVHSTYDDNPSTSTKVDKTQSLWKGNAPSSFDDSKSSPNGRLILVISGCDSDLSWIEEFTNGFEIHRLILYSKCNVNPSDIRSSLQSSLSPFTDVTYHPYIGTSTQAHSRWIASVLSLSHEQNPETAITDADLILFLKGYGDKPTPSFSESTTMVQRHTQRRSLATLQRSTARYDFACLAEPTGWSDADLSFYHDTHQLLKYTSNELAGPYPSMTDWLRAVDVDLHVPLVPVCYGGEFAVAGRRLLSLGLPFWKKWERELRTVRSAGEEHGYAERTWAGLLSRPLEEDLVEEVRGYATGVSVEEPFGGSLIRHALLTTGNRPEVSFKNEFPDRLTDRLIDSMWTGDVANDDGGEETRRFRKVFVVVSYCEGELDWLNHFFEGVEIAKVMVYSKCQKERPSFSFEDVSFHELKNVGHYHHTYAHVMANLPPEITEKDALIFLNADPTIDPSFKPRTLPHMLRIASSKGFGCRLHFKNGHHSAYHHEPTISFYSGKPQNFNDIMALHPEFPSGLKNMGDYLRSVDACLPTPLTEVCYGGGFAVAVSRIHRKTPSFWNRIADSLSRGEFVQESQFVERAWAGLLSRPLSDDSLAAMQSNKKIEIKNLTPDIRGTLKRESSRQSETEVEAMWRGDAVGGAIDAETHFKKLIMILSLCRNDLKWLDAFIHPFTLDHLTVYSICDKKTMGPEMMEKLSPYNPKFVPVTGGTSAHHIYAHWLAEKSNAVKDDDVYIFLKDEPLDAEFFSRSLKEMLRIASVTGFGCMVEFEDDHSAYHEFKTLSSYEPKADETWVKDGTTLATWLTIINATLPKPYTPVCYGGNFAVAGKNIKRVKPFIWRNIRKSLSRETGPRDATFAERSWAGLLTLPISDGNVTALEKYSNKGVKKENLSMGAMTRLASRPFYSEIDPLWRGDAHGGDIGIFGRVFLVISHCTNSLDWVEDFVKGVKVHSITIYSKCIVSPRGYPEGAILKRLPNVGRCDHTYAHWMATASSTLNKDDVVIFLKDTYIVHQAAHTRNLLHMMRITAVNGFGCWLELEMEASAYHAVSELLQYKKELYQRKTRDITDTFYSNFNNLGHWLTSVGGSLPEPYTQVCYGGIFVAKASQIQLRPPKFWATMAASLSRADNIEEGHYAERSWAGLLAKPISRDNIRSLRQYAEKNTKKFDYRGSLERRATREFYFEIDAFWKGDTFEGDLSIFRRIFLVIHHCRQSLAWLRDYTKEFLIQSIIIYSKCHHEPDYTPQSSTIVKLPNTGGYHHTYSYWLSHTAPKTIRDTDAIVFLTDNRQIKVWGRPRALTEMLNIASHTGFGCWLTPAKTRDFAQSDVSAFHNTQTLLSMSIEGARMNMREWVKSMNVTMPTYYANVCYGDNFVVKGSHIKRIPRKTFEKIEKSLGSQRVDLNKPLDSSIDEIQVAPEEQYAARVWAGMFSDEVNNFQKWRLQLHRTNRFIENDYKGALIRENI